MTRTQDPQTDGHTPRTDWLKLGGIVVGLVCAVTLMLLAFLAPQYNSGAKDLPLAVSGPETAVTELADTLEHSQPGAFDITVYDSPDAVRDAVHDRAEIGGISVSPGGTTVYTASGAGQTYAQILTGIGTGMQSRGQQVTFDEVAPTTDDDPTATGLSVLALPLAFGGMVSAVLLSQAMKRRYGLRVIGSLAFSALAGLMLGAVLQYGFGTFDGNYWETAGILGLGIAATSMVVLGLESVIGFPGLGIGAVFTLFIANPLSGIATGWQWLPSPWGAIGQYLPIGAAGNAVRSVAFFDGAGSAHSVWTLIAWVIVGAVFVGLAQLRYRRGMAPVRRRQAAAATATPATGEAAPADGTVTDAH